jgi:hypothetical protein
VSVRVQIRVQADFYCRSELEIFGSANGDDADRTAELLCETAQIRFVSEVTEKAFTLSHYFAPPPGKSGVGEILCCDAALTVTQVTPVGGKLVVKGRADIAALYAPEGDLPPESAEFSEDFSQIIEPERLTQESESDVDVILTGAFFDAGRSGGEEHAGCVCAELHAVAQCVVTQRRQVGYIADAFVPGRESECIRSVLETDSGEFERRYRCSVRDSLTAVGAVRIISVFAAPGLCEITRGDDGGAAAECDVEIICVYADETGRVRAARGHTGAKSPCGDFARLEGWAAEAETVGAQTGTVSGGGVEAQLQIEFVLTNTKPAAVLAVCGVTYGGEESARDDSLPSITIVRAKEGERVWDVAKRYGAGVNSILKSTGLDGEESVRPGDTLLVPRRRAADS